jgi:hypothetical protein
VTAERHRRLIYGGHIISLVRSLSFNGLANTVRIAALNSGRHVAPGMMSGPASVEADGGQGKVA